MEKIVAGPAGRGRISLEVPLRDNIRALAEALERPVGEITVALLDRPRNEPLIEECRAVGARVSQFGDGDVARGIMAVMSETSRIDMLAGIGGAPEGVVTAVAVKALGGEMQGRLWLRDERDRELARVDGLDPAKLLTLGDLCAADDGILAATGVTDGTFLAGVRYVRGSAYTRSLIVSTISRTVRTLDTRHILQPAIEFDVAPDRKARSQVHL
jgi:fructose-1,6-bisphosphatase II